MNDSNGKEKYVTYRWLITTVIASTASLLLLCGAIGNATFYSKSDGKVLKERSINVARELKEIKESLLRIEERMSR